MIRFLKQFVYGVFYLVIFALILWGFYSALQARPSQIEKKAGEEVPIPEFPEPTLVLEDLDTKIIGEQIRVTGILRNESPIRAEKVKIIATIFDKEGRELFLSQTLEEELKAFEARPFTVFFPKEKQLAHEVERQATKVFYVLQ